MVKLLISTWCFRDPGSFHLVDLLFSTPGSQGHSEGHLFYYYFALFYFTFFSQLARGLDEDIWFIEPGLELAPITSAHIPLARAWSQWGRPNIMVFMQEMCNILFFFFHLYLIFHFLANLNQTLLWFHVTLGPSLQPQGKPGSSDQAGGVVGEHGLLFTIFAIRYRWLPATGNSVPIVLGLKPLRSMMAECAFRSRI